MMRRLLITVSAISLLLCAAACGLGVRSYWRGEFVTWSRLTIRDDPVSDFVKADRYYSVDVGDGTGCFVLGFGDDWAQPTAPIPRWRYEPTTRPFDFRDPSGSRWARLGFYRGPGPVGLTDIAVPFWVLAGTFVLVPAGHGIWIFRNRSQCHAGRCYLCGYDLRASNDRCPECGTPIPPQMEKATA